MKGAVWESRYFDAYDKVLLNSDIYMAVRDFHVNAMHGCETILDSGSGTGTVTIELLKRGATVYAVDPSKKANDILREKCKQYADRLHVHEASAERLAFFGDEKFNGITSMFVIYYIDDWKSYLKEIYRVLKPGCILALTGRSTTQNKELILKSYEESLKKRNLLGRLEKEWRIFSEGFVEGVMPTVKDHTFDEMESAMERVGFKAITQYPNPYFGQCYSLTARK